MKEVKEISLAELIVAIILTVFAGLLLWVLVKVVNADGSIQYCYIHSNGTCGIPVYELYGFRAWVSDRPLGAFATFDEAVRAANATSCPLGRK